MDKWVLFDDDFLWNRRYYRKVRDAQRHVQELKRNELVWITRIVMKKMQRTIWKQHYINNLNRLQNPRPKSSRSTRNSRVQKTG